MKLSRIYVSVIVLLSVLIVTAAPPRTSKSVKTERQKTEKEIADTKRKINANNATTKKKLAELENINAGIQRQEREIEQLTLRLDTLQMHIQAAGDSVSALQSRVDSLRIDVKKSLVSIRERRKAVNNVAFIFYAPSFTAALKRIDYLGSLNTWRAHKIEQLRAQTKALEMRRNDLQALHDTQASLRSQLDATRSTLSQQKLNQQKAIERLRTQSKDLNKVLSEKQKKIRDLDRELDRIIAAEETRRKKQEEEKRKKQEANKKPAQTKTPSAGQTPAKPKTEPKQGTADADRKLSGSFVSNKGRLLFPVAGKYTIVGTFGRNAHRDISNVQVNNSGIDIAVAAGTTARAVFDGTVSSVFYMGGYNNIVIVRHGQYLTVYAGLVDLTVKKGDAVRAGTALGKVATSDGETVLHFEVRKERDKLNPLEWVR